ncbi:MAG: glycoside hydrolase family 38 C-terminal domain-containing protein [Oceanipulchritudo sp.]
MLTQSHLQQLIPQRLTELRGRLEKRIWTREEMPFRLAMTGARARHRTLAEARSEPLERIESFPFVWGRKFDQAWFQLEIPEAAFGPGKYLLWDDEGEATLHADGLPWYGFDAGHHLAPLPEEKRDLWIEGTCIRTGVWVNDGKSLSEEGSTHRGLSLWRRNERAWTTYWDYRILLDVMEFEYKRFLRESNDWDRGNGLHQQIFRISPLFRRIMRGLDAFADAYDHRGFRAGSLLKTLYRELPASSASLKGILTGHAHLDLVWHWPERIGEAKAVHTFATANRLLETYPEFRFGYSQPASYDAVARRAPALMEAVRDKIRAGTWEATGGSDVESDTQLPCGEALARSFMIGQERFRELRGEASRVLWLPDVFGYSACLPQILRQAGIPWFFTTKLTWGTVHRFPYSSFRWQGHDGSEVLVHVSQEVGYNGTVDLPSLKKMEECQVEAGIHNEFLVPTGYGDGGGGVNEEILERARRVGDLCGMPRCEWGGIEAFFARMEPLREMLPTWQGELYLEYHRGVQTTHGTYKAAFRAAERSLQVWEAAQSVVSGGPVDTDIWRRVIFSQFHDAIPGSSIQEVYDEQVPELQEIHSTCMRRACGSLGKGPRRRLFNPSPMARTHVLEEGLIDLPPLTCRLMRKTREPKEKVRAKPRSLVNGRIEARFNSAGEVDSLKVDGKPLGLVEPGNQLWLYPDHPHAYPAWDIDRGTLGNGKRVRGRAAALVEEASPVRGVVSFARQLTEKSRLVTRYILEAESPVLKIEWEFDWQDPEVLVKAVFPTLYNGRMARFGAPYGSTLRLQHPGDPRAEAMYEVPGSRWALLADDGEREGFTLVTEAKYGFTARSGTIGLSLLRSAFVTGSNAHRSIRQLKDRSPYSDLGPCLIRGAITAYRADLPREEQPAALAEHLYLGPVAVNGKDAQPLFRGLEGGNSLIPVWVQPLSDGSSVIRLNETMGRRGHCRVDLAEGTSAELVDLSGEAMSGYDPETGLLTFEPYGLYGLRVAVKGSRLD